MFERYSELARQAVFFALMEAQDMGTTAIDTDQLLIGILTAHPELPNEVALHVAPESMRSLREQPRPFSASSPKRADLPITPDLRQVMSRAVSIADLHHCQEIRTEHLFASLLEGGGKAAKLLAAFQIETQTLSEAPRGLAACEKTHSEAQAQTGLRLKRGIACALSGHCAGREY